MSRTKLKRFVESILSLLLNNVNRQDTCVTFADLAKKLDERIELLGHRRNGTNNELLTSLTHLKDAVIDLRTCIKNPDVGGPSSEENSTGQNELPAAESVRLEEASRPDTEAADVQNNTQSQLYTEEHEALQKEISQIKSSNKFTRAMTNFRASKDTAAKVFGNENERETKITATKIRVVSEILGNLTNLRGAAKECMDYISELHEIFDLRRSPFPMWYKALGYVKLEKIFESQEVKGLDSVIHINVVVFSFIKEFITGPVMLNWTMINIATQQDPERSENQNRPGDQKIYHPIFGEQPPKTNKPDPFTLYYGVLIDSQVSAVNCCGEVFCKKPVADHNTSTVILKIQNEDKEYFVHKEKRNILSISFNCTDCHPSNVSASSEFKLSLPNTPCKGNMFILAASNTAVGRVRYFLYVINMDGTTHHTEPPQFPLGFLESDKILQAVISCIRGEKLVILDVTSSKIYICNNEGKHFNTIRLNTESGYFRKPTKFSISFGGEIICSEGRSKLAIYNIEEDGSSLKKADELIEVKYVIQAVAFNHKSNELIILCHTSIFFQYHLVIYTKAGELKKDIKLQNGDYSDAELIFNQNGRVVLLDKYKLLHLL